MHQIEIHAAGNELYDLVIGVADGRISKAAITVFLEQRSA